MVEKRQRIIRQFIVRKKKIIALSVGLLIPTLICLCLFYEVYSVKTELRELKNEMMALNDYLFEEVTNAGSSQSVETEAIINNDLFTDVDQNENVLELDRIDVNGKIWDADSDIRRVYLTFDDGPSSNTNQILDILNEYGVKATFFVVGKEGYTEEYQRIVKEGHTLGMHSFSHRYQEIYESVDSYRNDLEKLHGFLYEMTGVDCHVVRFPGGSSNKASKVDMQDLITYLSEQNMTYYDWNVSSGDAAANYVSANQIANNVLKNIWKYDSVIVLMHDSSAKSTTVEALPIIIEQILESENTVLLPISEETVPIQHIKQNVNKGGKLEES